MLCYVFCDIYNEQSKAPWGISTSGCYHGNYFDVIVLYSYLLQIATSQSKLTTCIPFLFIILFQNILDCSYCSYYISIFIYFYVFPFSFFYYFISKYLIALYLCKYYRWRSPQLNFVCTTSSFVYLFVCSFGRSFVRSSVRSSARCPSVRLFPRLVVRSFNAVQLVKIHTYCDTFSFPMFCAILQRTLYCWPFPRHRSFFPLFITWPNFY